MRALLTTCALVLLVALAGCRAARPRPQSPGAWREAYADCDSGDPGACLWVAVNREQRGDVKGALAEYQRLCDEGFPDGCAEVSDHLRKGVGVERDLGKGYELARRACAEGSARGCHLEGIALFRGEGVPKDLATSTARYERSCAGGNGEACRDLGNALSQGRGVPVDLTRARALWRQECPRTELACVMLGRSYRREGKNELAVAAFREGCRAGFAEDCHEVGMLVPPSEALRYFRAACAWQDECGCGALTETAFRQGHVEEGLLVGTEACERGWTSSCAFLAMERPGLEEAERARQLAPLCEGGQKHACGWYCRHPALEGAAARCAKACELGLKTACAPK